MPPTRTSTPADDETDRLLDGIRDFLLASDRARQHMASTFGLSLSDLAALGYLGAADDLGQRELAKRLGLTVSATTSLIDRLENLGFANRHAHPSDRRRILIRLTPPGREVIDKVRELFAGALRGATGPDRAAAAGFVERLGSQLRDQLGATSPQ